MGDQAKRMTPLKLAVSPDGNTVIMVKDDWRQKVPASDLPKWISLYRGLRDREGGRFSAFYLQPVEALEALATKLGIRLPSAATSRAGARK